VQLFEVGGDEPAQMKLTSSRGRVQFSDEKLNTVR
jgi:hypothetical protein